MDGWQWLEGFEWLGINACFRANCKWLGLNEAGLHTKLILK